MSQPPRRGFGYVPQQRPMAMRPGQMTQPQPAPGQAQQPQHYARQQPRAQLTPQQQQQLLQQQQQQQNQQQMQTRAPLISNGRFAIDSAVFDIFRRLDIAIRKDNPQLLMEHIDEFDNRCDQIQLYCVCFNTI